MVPIAKGERRLQICFLKEISAMYVGEPSEELKSLCSTNRLRMEKTNLIGAIPVGSNILGWNKCELTS